ncbi:MAG TPA: nitrile hydratase subunit beta [Nocardioidaceae bacterium]|nr:nitrile hydratase subunit beta [Nocardioidaceae bacterium]
MPTWTDMGGRPEFYGKIAHSPDEPTFHQPWEGRVFGMTIFVQALVGPNIDAARYDLERLPREVYLASYYRRWLGGLESLLVNKGYLGAAELDARLDGSVAEPGSRRMPKAKLVVTARVLRLMRRSTYPRLMVTQVLPRALGGSRPTLSRRKFTVGDPVLVRGQRASGHTRQPGYVTGKPGVVTAHLGATLFPDAHATRTRARPQHLYTVSFEGSDLWGASAEAGTEVRVDLYESYLEPR